MKIKKISFSQILLIIITVVCFYIIGSAGLSIFPVLGYVEEPEKTNTVLLNLSYSFIAGLIFYLLVSYMPFNKRRKNVKPAISMKINTIHGKMIDSVRGLSPLTTNNHTNITEESLVALLANNSVFDPCGYAIAGVNMTKLQHMRMQRDEIKNIVKDLLDYKDYMSDDQLKLLEKIRESTYFSLLNAFAIPITDNQQIRESLAKEMYKQIQNTSKLKSTV